MFQLPTEITRTFISSSHNLLQHSILIRRSNKEWRISSTKFIQKYAKAPPINRFSIPFNLDNFGSQIFRGATKSVRSIANNLHSKLEFTKHSNQTCIKWKCGWKTTNYLNWKFSAYLAESEIVELHKTVTVHHYIFWFQIAMDQIEKVEVFQGEQDLGSVEFGGVFFELLAAGWELL